MYADNNDLAKYKKELAQIQNPDTLPSFSRRLLLPTDKGVRMFLEVRGFGVLILEAYGADAVTGKMRWRDCGILTNEEIGYYRCPVDK